ncbi:biotin--[acetyl-CoA-carboxylase] ligase [Clostridium sp. Sa3CUN1]|uniref:Bifunctional ligase/repressor BirA n=1 Tax=Clostridium gallinarum TaxID=2762246 RepID=A0ABR8Q5P9_9CLOT|nr:biotin--[acetyl-CoA-carboxylase] ligase [Clostridium gallinarum]MBD7915756.1 biotin--[acetyl-CoA-carboxylase] ligase [Clostridium gallinarum]
MSVKNKTLYVLENNKGDFISGTEIAKNLSVSRNAVWKSIRILQNEGYNILAVKNKGYCLSIDTDILSPQSITKYLNNKNTTNFNISVYKTITSTNDLAKELAIKGANEGTIIIAEEQSKGRGRFNRKFYSPKGTGIYMSIVLRPKLHASNAFLITIAAAVAVSESIDLVCNKETKIKWVNDIYCDNKKVCGILTEASMDFESGMVDYVILGIGINVKEPEKGFADEIKDIATSILDNDTPLLENIRSKLISEILNRFWVYYENIENRSFIDSYKKRSLLIGKNIIIHSKNNFEKAIVLEIDDDCKLKVKMEDGSVRLLSSGEVSIKKCEP